MRLYSLRVLKFNKLHIIISLQQSRETGVFSMGLHPGPRDVPLLSFQTSNESVSEHFFRRGQFLSSTNGHVLCLFFPPCCHTVKIYEVVPERHLKVEALVQKVASSANKPFLFFPEKR